MEEEGDNVHGVDVAHKDVTEQKVQLVFGAFERGTKRVDADGILVVLVDGPHWSSQFHRVDRIRGVPNPIKTRTWAEIDRENKQVDVRKRKREVDLFQTGYEPRVLVSGLDVHRTVELTVDRIDSVARDVRQTGPTIDERDRLALFHPLDGRCEVIVFSIDRHGVHRNRPTRTRGRSNGILGCVRNVAELGVVFADGEETARGLFAIVGPLECQSDQVRRRRVLRKHVCHDGSG